MKKYYLTYISFDWVEFSHLFYSHNTKSSHFYAGFFCFIDKFRGAYDMIRENQVVAKL